MSELASKHTPIKIHGIYLRKERARDGALVLATMIAVDIGVNIVKGTLLRHGHRELYVQEKSASFDEEWELLWAPDIEIPEAFHVRTRKAKRKAARMRNTVNVGKGREQDDDDDDDDDEVPVTGARGT